MEYNWIERGLSMEYNWIDQDGKPALQLIVNEPFFAGASVPATITIPINEIGEALEKAGFLKRCSKEDS